MIVSHDRRFIFVKTSKTAGTSVEMQLSVFCGPDDIVTPGMENTRTFGQYPECRGLAISHFPFTGSRMSRSHYLLSFPPQSTFGRG